MGGVNTVKDRMLDRPDKLMLETENDAIYNAMMVEAWLFSAVSARPVVHAAEGL